MMNSSISYYVRLVVNIFEVKECCFGIVTVDSYNYLI